MWDTVGFNVPWVTPGWAAFFSNTTGGKCDCSLFSFFFHGFMLRHSATSFRPLSHLHCFTEATTMQGVNRARGSRGWNQGVMWGYRRGCAARDPTKRHVDEVVFSHVLVFEGHMQKHRKGGCAGGFTGDLFRLIVGGKESRLCKRRQSTCMLEGPGAHRGAYLWSDSVNVQMKGQRSTIESCQMCRCNLSP